MPRPESKMTYQLTQTVETGTNCLEECYVLVYAVA